MVQIDQRISLVAGYMTEEVSGLSPFNFMHKDDVRWVMVALRQSKFPFNIFKFLHQLTLNFFSQCMIFQHLMVNPAIV